MANTANLNVRLVELQSMPFSEVLPLIVNLPDFMFWRIVQWLAEDASKMHQS